MKFTRKMYHVTTSKKLERYEVTGAILPPVRYWTTTYSALKWMNKTGRNVLLSFDEPTNSHPLPMKGGAKWSDGLVVEWDVIYVKCPSPCGQCCWCWDDVISAPGSICPYASKDDEKCTLGPLERPKGCATYICDSALDCALGKISIQELRERQELCQVGMVSWYNRLKNEPNTRREYK